MRTATGPSPLKVLVLLPLLTGALGSCRSAREATDGEMIPLVPAATAGEIVARVNGVPILAEELTLQMRGGQPRRQALNSLIQRELLAQEAHRRGYARRPDTARAFKRALAYQLIRREFGDGVTPETIPRRLVERAYKINKTRYVHEEVVLLAHILVKADKSDDEAHHQKARQLIAEVRRRALRGPRSEDAFKQLAKDLSVDSDLSIKAESLGTQRRGTTVPAFADAAFALRRPGDVSPVVKTNFGYHVIYYKDRLPAIDRPLQEVEGEIRDRIFEEYRIKAFDDWAVALEKRSAVADYSARLDGLPTAQ